MRRRRITSLHPIGYYHLMSRTVNGEAWFGDNEREVLRKMIHQVSDFSGIRVITYAVMKNHFHLLVEVRREVEISDAELVRRYRVLYPSPTLWQPMSADALAKILEEDTIEARQIRSGLLRRMHDASWLMKTLKQRFSNWFNKSRDRFGPVWAERFKSVLVEGDFKTLRTVAAYIDLNSVRSGIVEDPKDYRFCGYSEAVAGHQRAQEGLLGLDLDLAKYRKILFGAGMAPKDGKESISREDALKVLESENGELPLHVLLRCQIRYFSEGIALGSCEFVEEITERINRYRKRPARPHFIHGFPGQFLCALKAIRKNTYR